MNIVFSNSNSPLTQGLASTLEYCGHSVSLWNKTKKPVFDMLYELKPELMLIYKKDIDNALQEAVKQYKTPCVVLESSEIFDPFIPFDPLPACNPVQYGNAIPLYKYKTDVMYFSHVSSVKGIPFLDVLTKYKFKIFGQYIVPYPQYLGYLSSIKEYRNAMKSTKVFVDINGYDTLNAALMEVNSTSYGLNPLVYPECFNSFLSLDELTEQLDRIIKKPKFNKEQKKFVLQNTFFHRVYDLFKQLGNIGKAQEVMYKWHSIVSEF